MKKRRILLALIMLIISAISLTTATYAWFTANRKVSVEEIDVKATASGGIQISADAEHWSNEVNIEDLLADGLTENFIPKTALKPVTTIGVNGGQGAFDFYLGELNDAGDKVKLTKVADSDNHYISFDLYFYSATAQTIEFGAGTQVLAKNVDGTGEAVDAKLRTSARVGFLVQGNDPTSTPDTAKAMKGGILANQTIWEPNADVHTDYAISMLGAKPGEIDDTLGGKAPADPEVVMDDGTHFELVDGGKGLKTSTEGQKYPSGTIFDFQPGITKVRVYVWLEGQDIDNEDTASLGTGVGVKLDFQIAGTGV